MGTTTRARTSTILRSLLHPAHGDRVEFAEEAARTHGANALYIDTGWENTPARSLYEKQGFYGRELRYEKLFRLPDPP